MTSRALAICIGIALGLLAGIPWLLADHVASLALHSLGFDIKWRAFFANWLTPVLGLGIALVVGFLAAKLFRRTPMYASAGVAVGVLAVFVLPQALIRGDVSVYLAGPQMLIPTLLGLPILAIVGGRLGSRTT